MGHLAVKVPVIESERGWGSKIDDYMVCVSVDDAQAFIKKFNSSNTEATVPDWYMRADNDITPIDLTDEQFALLDASPDKRMWFKSLK